MKYRLLIATFILSIFAQPTFAANTFNDVTSSTSYVDSIYWTINEGITQGYGDGKWGPDICVTRAELLKMMLEYSLGGDFEMAASDLTGDDGFSDVNKTDWFYDYVRYAKESEVVEGYKDGTFKPNDCVNRVEAMKVAVAWLMPGEEIDTSAPLTYWGSHGPVMVDMDANTWYSPYARVLFNSGLVGTAHTRQAKMENGSSQDYLNFFPDEDMTRKEVAYMMQQIDKHLDYNAPTPKPTPAPSPEPVPTLKSAFFKNDTETQAFIKTTQPLDLEKADLYSKTYVEYSKTLPYRTLIALQMIGYQNEYTTIKSSKSVLPVLQRFQKDNNFPVTNTLTNNVIAKLDAAVYQKEQEISGYSKKMGTIFESFASKTLLNQFPEDYIAWVFTYPLEVLPEHLTENLTPANYAICIATQCVGSINEPSEMTAFTGEDYGQNNFTFYPDIFNNDLESLDTNKIGISLQKSTKQFSVILHEFSHYLDGNGQNSKPEMNAHFIDTTSFKEISFMPNENNSFNASCLKRKTDVRESFITKYGYDGTAGPGCTKLGPEYGAPYEDFAESFTAYVMAGKVFREAASQNNDLEKKYNWLKENVFKGQEYNTNIPYGASYTFDGCKDATDVDLSGGPFYLSCDSDFVWNGKVEKL